MHPLLIEGLSDAVGFVGGTLVGAGGADAIFTVEVSNRTESLFLTTCSATTSGAGGVRETNMYLWDSASARPLAGGISLADAAYPVLRAVTGGAGCSTMLLKLSDDAVARDFGGSLGGSYVLVVEPAAPGATGALSVIFNRTCACGFYGDTCSDALNVSTIGFGVTLLAGGGALYLVAPTIARIAAQQAVASFSQ
jgi:hypothetical protein